MNNSLLEKLGALRCIGAYDKKHTSTYKGLLTLFLIVIVGGSMLGQGSEDFSNIPASNASYSSRSWTGTNSVTWTASAARTDRTMNGKAITTDATTGSGITSPIYSGGMGVLQFNYVRDFTGAGTRTIQVFVNGVQQGSNITVSTSSNTVVAYSSTINIAGNVQLNLKTSGGGQIKIDDISWTSYSALTTPTLSADATLNTVDNPIDITFTDDSAWRAAVTAVKIGATSLTSGTDYDLTAGNLQLKPSGLNGLLNTSGSKSVTVVATGYTDATVTQVINAGAPTANSTATISAALAPNTSRTITCTAKDQYNNLVSGYTFAYDVTLTNNNSTTAESYTIDGSTFTTTSTSGNPVATTTNASGVATFTAALPATIDPSDGISVQVQLNDDATNVGSAFTFAQLASQTITFGSLSTVTYGDTTFGLTATASSTLPVSYTSSNTAVATVTGSTVTIVGAGSTNITVSQAGNGSYNAAEDVIQSLTVNAKELTLPDAAATSRAYNTLLTTNITGTFTGVINSDDVTLVGTLKGTFADANVANGIAVTSACTLSGTKAGNYTLTQPTGLTANITQASQTITFGVLANKIIGAADYSPGATSTTSVTNAITYASSNLDVATIVSNQIQIVGIGSTNITASQAGSLNYTAATDVVKSLTVIAAPIAAWDFTGVGSVTNTSLAATTLDNGLGATSITRGADAVWSNASNSWRTTGFQNNGISTGNTDYFQITIQANTGKTVSLTTIDANFAGTGTFTVSPGVSSQFAYSLDGTNFTLIGSPTETIGTPATMTQIDLTAVTALQNVASGTTITLRYYASGQTTSGGWGFNSVSAGTNGLAIGGVTTLVSTTWTGSAWTSGAPTSSLDAIISGNLATSTDLICDDLTINSGMSLEIGAGNKLTVSGNLINNGTLIFKSNATNTAMFDVFNGSQSGNGLVTVERYIPLGKRAFRFLTPSVTTTSSIYTNWQIDGATTTGRGTHITGSTSGANGFDVTASGNPSMFTYENNVASGTGWLAIPNTNATALTAGMGYRTLVRGDRNVNISVASTDDMNVATTLSATGTLKVGNVVFNSTSTPALNNTISTASNTTTNDYSLIGNPYASPVNWELVSRTNVADFYYTWDPNMGTLAERGRYVAYSAGSHVATNSGSGTSYVSRYIQPGQAIFVKTTAASPVVTFKEADKAATFTNVFRTNTNSTLSVSVYNPSEVAFAAPIDGTIAVFGTDFDASVGYGDVEKLYSSGEHLAWSRGTKLLAMDATTPVVTSDELLLKTMQFSANKSYTFKVNTTNFDSSLTGYLVDQYLNSQTLLDFSTSNFITFATTTDAASYGADRFKVVFNSSALNNEEWNTKSLRIYPNPVVDNQFTIAVSPSIADKVTICIYNMIGQSVYRESATAINNSIVVHPSAILKAGVYMVEMANNGKTSTQKIIIK